MNRLVLDTETVDMYHRHTPYPTPSDMLVYDFGYNICDGKGKSLVTRSFVIAESFLDNDMMQTAYFAEKIPNYKRGITCEVTTNHVPNKWALVTIRQAYEIFRADIREYDVKEILAYNVKFDTATLNNTIRHYSNGFMKYFMPYGIKVVDIWDWATCITDTNKYVKWCQENDYMSDKGNPKTSAEIVYRYIHGDHTFIEDHTALSDAMIETEIMLACIRRKQKRPTTKGQGWRKAANRAKAMR